MQWGHPEWHIRDDALRIINGYSNGYGCPWFTTDDGKTHDTPEKWDLIIAHPPCTYLTVTGNRSFNVEKYGDKALKRLEERERAMEFFMAFIESNCPRVAVENPIGYMSTHYRKPDQIIHPWMFALTDEENTTKATCLWLKGLPTLKPTHSIKPDIEYFEWVDGKGKRKRQTMWYYKTRCMPHSERARMASKTFPGVAAAMASQWGGDIR